MSGLIGTIDRWVKPTMYLASMLVFIVVGVFLFGELLPYLGRVGWPGTVVAYVFIVVLLYWALRIANLSIEAHRDLWKGGHNVTC